MTLKEKITLYATTLALISTMGAAAVWAADQRYITNEDMLIREIRDLDRQVTFLEIKVSNGEASTSEKVYVESLKQQLRDLKQQVE